MFTLWAYLEFPKYAKEKADTWVILEEGDGGDLVSNSSSGRHGADVKMAAERTIQ
jgi:hypothetical protein